MLSLSSICRLPASNVFKLSDAVLSKCPMRLMSQKCSKKEQNPCGSRFKGEPCSDKGKPKKKKLPQPAPPPLDREHPEITIKRSLFCCGDPCPDSIVPFDKLYYKRTDKAKRKYQQTWDECPELLIKPKVICCIKPIKPKFEKRPRKERPPTACKQDVCLQSKTKCPHIRMPKCRPGRKPPSCLTQRKPAKCKKRKAPYPSFSECKHPPYVYKGPVECNCLAVPSICEVWAYYHKQKGIRKPEQC